MRATVQAELDASDEGQRELDVRLGLGVFASEIQLDHLLSISRQVDVAAGQVLYKRGDPARHLLQVVSGNIELRAPDLPTWNVADAGTAGFLDFMLERPHSRTAVSTTAARVLELDASDYLEYLEDNFEVSHRILARMSSELAAQSVTRREAAEVFAFATSEPASHRYTNVEIPVIERMMLLARMPAFARASMQALASLGQSARETRNSPGDVLVATGERPTSLSVLVQGTVELSLPGGQRAIRTGPALLAHVEELSDTPRLAAITAVTAVISLQVDREELLDRIEEHFDLGLSLFRFLAGCQEQMNDLTVAAGIPLGLSWM